VRVAVAGAGLAGLAAACELADAGHAVTVCERRPWAGGKTYSTRDRETGEEIDNGQHIAMRCTTEYVRFLRRVGSEHLIAWQPRLRVPVYDAQGRRSALAADALPAPLHLARSFAAYRHLRPADKLRAARAVLALRRTRANDASLGAESFAAWLRAHGQTARAIATFWDLILVPALNCTSEQASAAQAAFVFREGFLRSAEAAAIGVPKVGLSALHVEPALRYIEARGGELHTGCTIARVEIDEGAVRGLALADGGRIEADAYVLALPPRELREALPPGVASRPPFDALARFAPSPIVNLHLWWDRPVLPEPFAAFTGSDVQWLFARGQAADGAHHTVISLSAARQWIETPRREIEDALVSQLRRALPAARAARVLRSALIKEPEATFVPAPGLRRPGVRTPFANLAIAGAYTDTGWPATMESAVRSGLEAARAVAARTWPAQDTERAAVAV